MEKREPSYTSGGNANWHSHYGEQCADCFKNWEQNCHMTQKSHCWAYTPRIPELNQTHVPQCSLQHFFTITRIWKHPRCPSIDEWIPNTQLLSYKMEHIWVHSKEVNEPGAYYIEWSKSERKRQMLYINTYTWELERCYWQSYMQGSNGDTDVKNRLLDSMGEGEDVMIWRRALKHVHYHPCKIDVLYKFDEWSRAPKASALEQPRGIGWGARRDGGSG